MPTSLIADELGVSQAALFKRCGTKQALMLKALGAPTRPAWIDEVLAGPDDRPVPEQLLRLVERIDTYFEQLLPAIAVLRAAKIDPEQMLREHEAPPPLIAHRAVTGWFQRLHERGRARVPHPQSTAMAFLGAIHARHMLCHVLREHAPQTEPEFLTNLVDVFWRGIAPAERSPEESP